MDNDRIERRTFIDASLQTVWDLVSQPAWWVGDKPGPDRVRIDGIRIEADTRYGTFPVLIEKSEPPNYLACRWASSFPGEEPGEGNSTLVEFTLTEKDGGTQLRIVESGFSSLDVSDKDQGRFFEENQKGWNQQLKILQQRAEQ